MFFARSRNHRVETPRLHIFLELLIPQGVEMIAKFLRQLPSLLRR